MLYVFMGIAVAMSFMAGVEYVLLRECRKKLRYWKNKCESLNRDIHIRETRDKIVKEIAV